MPRLTALVRSDQPLVQPLYQEVAAVIASEIESGALRRGALLPPERLMCEQLRVSRVTLRRALGILQHEGKVVPSHGRGWFVNDTRLSELPNVLQGFSDLVTGRRLRAGTVSINGTGQDYCSPFGGFKQSGNGREWGRFGFEEYLEVKAIAGMGAK